MIEQLGSSIMNMYCRDWRSVYQSTFVILIGIQSYVLTDCVGRSRYFRQSRVQKDQSNDSCNTTAVVTSVSGLLPARCCDLQSPKPKDQGNSNLPLCLHMQTPQNWYWKDEDDYIECDACTGLGQSNLGGVESESAFPSPGH